MDPGMVAGGAAMDAGMEKEAAPAGAVTTEAATQLDVLHIRRFISSDEYQQARALLVRVAQMLSRLCGAPRRS
jgi:hypothetical protein